MNAIDSLQLAADLRATIGELVRHLRTGDELPQNQAGVLGRLVREGPHTTAELAERQRVRHQSMARTVALLMETGLVRQEPHPSDGRKLLLTATEAGAEALYAQRRDREQRIAAAIERELTQEEREVLRQAVGLLQRIT